MALFKTNQNVFEMSVFEYAKNVYGDVYSIPAFQREYVWKKGANKKKVHELLDSIYKGYNIGTIVFWESSLLGITRTRDNLNPQTKKGMYTYILDGQQRTLTLLTLFSQSQVVEIELKSIIIELNKKKGIIEFNKAKKDSTSPSMTYLDFKNKILFSGIESYDFYSEYSKQGFSNEIISQFKENISIFLSNIKGEELLVGYKLKLGPSSMDKAIEQFEKINESGIKLNYFEILDAVAYSTNFKLSDQYRVFNEKFDGIVKSNSFEQSSMKIILNSFKLIKNYRFENSKEISMSQNAIANFERGDEEILMDIIKAFKTCSAELYAMGLGSLKDVPWTPNITMYIFFKVAMPDIMFEIKDSDFLYKIMFQTGMTKRYAKSSTQALIKDIKSVEKSLRTNTPIYLSENSYFEITTNDILTTNYNKMGPMEKAILLYWTTVMKPVDFNQKSEIKLDNFSHKASNLDHIFPKSNYKNVDTVNTMANIELMESKTNILKSNKNPSDFFASFDFPKYEDVYASHDISNELYLMLMRDNAHGFITNRASSIAESLQDHFKEMQYKS